MNNVANNVVDLEERIEPSTYGDAPLPGVIAGLIIMALM